MLICVLRAKSFVLIDIMPLGSGSHVFAHPDPESQNIAVSTDPDTKP